MTDDVTFCGVFDGHGPHGHLVARKVRDALPLKLVSFLNSCQSKEVGPSETSNSFVMDFALATVKQGSNLFMGNIGDSRAIMATKDNNDSLVAIQLTVDLKPDLPRKAERIKRCKGRVFALQDEPEVCRVWLPFDDALGLAMSRAFGDFCLKEYGVITVPEFSHRMLTDKDQFIVMASDGVARTSVSGRL